MLCLLLTLNESLFAFPCAQVVRIVPKIQLRPIPHAPSYIAGLLHYRGGTVPVVDLCALTNGRPASNLLSSRIILMNYKTKNESTQLLGVLAEGVMETVTLDQAKLSPATVRIEGVLFLGSMISTDKGLIQLIDPEKIFSDSVREQLFPAALSLA
jgi:chemotaxis-related protein WspB